MSIIANKNQPNAPYICQCDHQHECLADGEGRREACHSRNELGRVEVGVTYSAAVK